MYSPTLQSAINLIQFDTYTVIKRNRIINHTYLTKMLFFINLCCCKIHHYVNELTLGVKHWYKPI